MLFASLVLPFHLLPSFTFTMSLSTALSHPLVGRNPFVATYGFLNQNKLLVEYRSDTSALPVPWFVAAGAVDAAGELETLVVSSQGSPGGSPTLRARPPNGGSLAEHWN